MNIAEYCDHNYSIRSIFKASYSGVGSFPPALVMKNKIKKLLKLWCGRFDGYVLEEDYVGFYDKSLRDEFVSFAAQYNGLVVVPYNDYHFVPDRLLRELNASNATNELSFLDNYTVWYTAESKHIFVEVNLTNTLKNRSHIDILGQKCQVICYDDSFYTIYIRRNGVATIEEIKEMGIEIQYIGISLEQTTDIKHIFVVMEEML